MKLKLVIIAGAVLLTARGAGARDLDTVVVSAARYSQPGERASGNISVLTRADIAASGARAIPELLRQSPGVYLYQTGTARSSVADIRGFGETAASNVLVLIDGRKVNQADISAPDLTQVPLEAVERIEIIRGAGSVLYGDQAVGGVINIVTREGEGDFSGSLAADAGSYNARGVSLEVSGEEKALSYFVFSKFNDNPGYRDNSGLLAKDANARLGYAASDQLYFDLSLGYHDDRQNLPGGLNASELASLGRRATVSPDDVTFTTDRFARLGSAWVPRADEDYIGRLELDLSYRGRKVSDRFNQFGPFHTRRAIDTAGAALKYIFDRELFERDINFVTGVDFYDTENAILGSGDNVDDLTIYKRELGVYGQAELEMFRDLYASAGTRYQRAAYTFDQRNVPVYQKQSPDEWVSSGGLKYVYAPGSNVHAGVQQSFRFLATDEWYSTANFPGFGITPGLNLDLLQQSGFQVEAGVRHRAGDDLVVLITPYWIELDNEIYFDPVTFGNANFEGTRRLGIEIGQRTDLSHRVKADWMDRLDFYTNYTVQRATQEKGGNAGKDIPFVARNQLSFGILAGIFQYYQVSLSGNYTGSRFPVSDLTNNAPKVKSRVTLDARLAFDWKSLEGFFAVNNLTGREYSSYVVTNAALTNTVYYPAEERNYEFGVKVNF